MFYSISGALVSMTRNSSLELVSEAYVLLVCPDDSTVLAVFY